MAVVDSNRSSVAASTSTTSTVVISCNFCPVCQSQSIAPTVFPCGHSICTDFCLPAWEKQKNSCPVCRKPLRASNTTTESDDRAPVESWMRQNADNGAHISSTEESSRCVKKAFNYAAIFALLAFIIIILFIIYLATHFGDF